MDTPAMFKKLEAAGMPDNMAVAHTIAFRAAMEAFHAGKPFDSDRYFVLGKQCNVSRLRTTF